MKTATMYKRSVTEIKDFDGSTAYVAKAESVRWFGDTNYRYFQSMTEAWDWLDWRYPDGEYNGRQTVHTERPSNV